MFASALAKVRSAMRPKEGPTAEEVLASAHRKVDEASPGAVVPVTREEMKALASEASARTQVALVLPPHAQELKSLAQDFNLNIGTALTLIADNMLASAIEALQREIDRREGTLR